MTGIRNTHSKTKANKIRLTKFDTTKAVLGFFIKFASAYELNYIHH